MTQPRGATAAGHTGPAQIAPPYTLQDLHLAFDRLMDPAGAPGGAPRRPAPPPRAVGAYPGEGGEAPGAGAAVSS